MFQANSVWIQLTARCARSRFPVITITILVLQFRVAKPMRAPYGLNIIDNCLTCPVREEHLFCNLPVDALQKLNEIKSTAVYPKSAVLFIEGQQPRGVFVLCTGKVKLSTSSSEGKTLITKISDPGDVLGLNATISNHPYEVTAEMIEPGQANFIPRDALLRFLREHGEVALRVAEQLHTRKSGHWGSPVPPQRSSRNCCFRGIQKKDNLTARPKSSSHSPMKRSPR